MLSAPATSEKKAGLAYWANRVLEECDKAKTGFAADPVHDLRVAIRRCRSMADGFMSVDPDPAWKQMKRLAKPLFSSLGELRDIQVMLEWVTKLAPADDPIRATLSTDLQEKEKQLKTGAQKSLAGFDRKRWQSLNAHLAKRTSKVPLEGLVFQHLALERWMEARELHRRALRNRSGAAWHQLRIGIKRFRYTVENFLPQRHAKWAKDLRILQDALGEVHDFDVLRAMIKGHPELSADERAQWHRRLNEERQERLDLYRKKMVGRDSLWQLWRAELPSRQELEEAALEKLCCWASFLDPAPQHSNLVARLTLELYDGLLQCGILRHAPNDRRLVEAAALLHEVGRGKFGRNKTGGHQKRGQRLIRKLKAPLGWTTDDMQRLAALVRYHRGALPSGRAKSPFVGLEQNRRRDMMGLLGVLRLANALDDSHQGRVTKLEVTRRDGSVAILVRGLQALSHDAQCAAGARYLLETVCRLPISIRPVRGAGAREFRAAGGEARAARAQ